MKPYIFMLIFSLVLFVAAAALYFSRDPRNSPLLFRVYGLKRMSKTDAVLKAKDIARGVALSAAAILIGSIIGLIAGNIGWVIMVVALVALPVYAHSPNDQNRRP